MRRLGLCRVAWLRMKLRLRVLLPHSLLVRLVARKWMKKVMRVWDPKKEKRRPLGVRLLNVSPGTKKAFNVEFSELDTGGHGSCGYSALAVGYRLMRGNKLEDVKKDGFKKMETTLRVQIADHIQRHPGVYRPFCASDWMGSPEKDDGISPKSWDEWLESLTRPKRWICQLSMCAGARRLDTSVLLFCKRVATDLGAIQSSWESPVKRNFRLCLAMMPITTLCFGARLWS